MDYFSILFHKKFDYAVPLDGKYYEALFSASSGGEWSETTITGTTPIYFKSNGDPLTDYLISGNAVQNGTPTPEAPVDVVGCGVETENLIDNGNIVSGGLLASVGTVPTPYDNPKRCRYNHFFAVASKTIFYDFKDLSVNIVMMDSNGLSLGGPGFLSGAGSVTFLSNTEKISLIIAKSDHNEGITVDYARSKNISLDYGYKLPITIGGTEYPIYLGQVETTRRVKKLVLTGAENVEPRTSTKTGNTIMRLDVSGYMRSTDYTPLSSHYIGISPISEIGQFTTSGTFAFLVSDSGSNFMYIFDNRYTTASDFKSYLAGQYAAGTPVTIWYVLAEPETAVVNEPLMKIGDYADTVSYAQAGVTIPTVSGTNVLDMNTTPQPSNVSITGHIKPISN